MPKDRSVSKPSEANMLDIVSNAVFEIVVPKPVKDSLSYEKPLPLDRMPYAVRNDEYYSIGTAFAINPSEFVTATHVTYLGYESLFKEIYLRDQEGKVYDIDKIIKYSESRDFVLFTLKDKRADVYLELNTKPQINRKVFAVGNALGEGIVIRDGLYTSDTPEQEEGEWDWIRFSAAASPGNSGGPLLDEDGKVIGIVLLKSPNENLNYALPISEVINAKADVATAHKTMGYFFNNMKISKLGRHKKNIALPKSYRELDRELIDGTKLYTYNLIKALFKDNKNNIFPNGKGSNSLLHNTYDAVFPHLIMKREDGVWNISSPKEINEAELGNNGHLKYGSLDNSLFFYLQKPDDISLEDFYGNSKLFMDLILKGFNLPRQIGTEKIKIMSLGKSSEDYTFTDSYGRKWLVKTWLLEYSDEKIITFSLPVPGGCVTMMRAGQTGLVNNGHIPDLKALTNFVYVSYDGTLKQWQEFLEMKGLLPSVFSSIDMSFEYNKEFNYRSKRISFFLSPETIDISEKSHMKLMFSYFKENDATVWDVSSILIGKDKNSGTHFIIKRNTIPSKELDDTYQSEWTDTVKQKFPFNRSAYFSNKATHVGTVIKKSDADSVPVLYSVEYSEAGKVDQNRMEARLDGFMQSVTVYDDGQSGDMAYSKRKDAYHDKGDYYQALWDYDRIKDINPRTADSYILRGEVYKDKGDFERALTDYSKAVEISPESIQTYFSTDFTALLYGVNKQFTEAKKEIKKVLESNPQHTSAETLIKAAEDVIAQKIKEETAVKLFKGAVFDYFNMLDEAIDEYTKAISKDFGYNVSYDFRGLAHVGKKEYALAITDYSRAIELNPKDITAYNRRGVVRKILGEYDRAIADYNSALQINSEYSKALNNRGGAYDYKGEYDLAIADYNKVLKIRPLDSGVYFNRGIAFNNKGLYDQAISDYNEAINLNPGYVEAISNRAGVYRTKGDFDNAISGYSMAIELNPLDAEAYVGRGNVYDEKGDYYQALSDYDKAIHINPRYAKAYVNKGMVYDKKGDFDRALINYSKAIEIDPAYSIAYNNRGIILGSKGDLDQATSDFSKAIEIDQKNAKAYVNRGNVHRKNGDLEQAIADYSMALEINPDNERIINNRGTTHLQKGELDLALLDFNRVIRTNSENAGAYFNRALLKHMKKEYQSAIADYKKAIEINPEYFGAFYNRGNIYQESGATDQAISDYDRALEINPMSAKAYNKRGLAYSDTGNLQHAMLDLNKALEINPEYAETYIHRGMTYGRSGEHDRAISDFNRAIEIDPKLPLAYNNRGYSFMLTGKHEKAIEDFNRSLEINPGNIRAYINRGNAFYSLKNRTSACADWKQACMLGACNNYMRAEKTGYCE